MDQLVKTLVSLLLQISELLKSSLSVGSTVAALSVGISSETEPSPEVQFHSLQYALFTTNFVEVLGGLFFLFTALYIVRDKENAERELAGEILLFCLLFTFC